MNEKKSIRPIGGRPEGTHPIKPREIAGPGRAGNIFGEPTGLKMQPVGPEGKIRAKGIEQVPPTDPKFGIKPVEVGGVFPESKPFVPFKDMPTSQELLTTDERHLFAADSLPLWKRTQK